MAWLLAPCLAAGLVHAQVPDDPRAQAEAAASAGTGAGLPTTELDPVRVTGKRPEWVDPFAFRPLFDPDANRFQRHWNEPPSVEEVSLGGGYILLGVNYGLLKAAEAVTRLPGWQHQIQPAVARPPPLDDAQAERAARLRETGVP